MSALQGFNKLIILFNGSLIAYSLDLVARVGLGQTNPEILEASLERLPKPDRNGTIIFFRVGTVAEKVLGLHALFSSLRCNLMEVAVVYASKSFLSFTLTALEAVGDRPTNTLQRMQSQSTLQKGQTPSWSLSFRPYGEVRRRRFS